MLRGIVFYNFLCLYYFSYFIQAPALAIIFLGHSVAVTFLYPTKMPETEQEQVLSRFIPTFSFPNSPLFSTQAFHWGLYGILSTLTTDLWFFMLATYLRLSSKPWAHQLRLCRVQGLHPRLRRRHQVHTAIHLPRPRLRLRLRLRSCRSLRLRWCPRLWWCLRPSTRRDWPPRQLP